MQHEFHYQMPVDDEEEQYSDAEEDADDIAIPIDQTESATDENNELASNMGQQQMQQPMGHMMAMNENVY